MDALSVLFFLSAGNPPVPGGFFLQKPLMQSIGGLFVVSLDKLLKNSPVGSEKRRINVHYMFWWTGQ